MADADLIATDGVSDHYVRLKGLELSGGQVEVRFEIVRNGHIEPSEHVAELRFFVTSGTDFREIIAQGFDQLVDALKQMLYVAAVTRTSYRPEV